jgi:hypothetical protein
VVSAGSADAVIIRILPNGPTYSSDAKRLRKVRSGDGDVQKSEAGAAAAAAALDMEALRLTLAKKVPALARTARPNPHAAPGTPLHTRFMEAAAAAEGKVVDAMLHGTHDSNVDSILQESLRGRACGTCWFTDDLDTASGYAGGAKRMIAFAVLRDKGHTHPIYTTKQPAHHLPLFEMER